MEQRKRIRERLESKSGFLVVAELTGGPNFDFGPIGKFLSAYKKAGPDSIPAGFDFAGIMLPQNPGGVVNIDPGHAIDRLNAEGCWAIWIVCRIFRARTRTPIRLLLRLWG